MKKDEKKKALNAQTGALEEEALEKVTGGDDRQYIRPEIDEEAGLNRDRGNDRRE